MVMQTRTCEGHDFVFGQVVRRGTTCLFPLQDTTQAVTCGMGGGRAWFCGVAGGCLRRHFVPLQDGSMPMHLAAAGGHDGAMKVLIEFANGSRIATDIIVATNNVSGEG